MVQSACFGRRADDRCRTARRDRGQHDACLGSDRAQLTNEGREFLVGRDLDLQVLELAAEDPDVLEVMLEADQLDLDLVNPRLLGSRLFAFVRGRRHLR